VKLQKMHDNIVSKKMDKRTLNIIIAVLAVLIITAAVVLLLPRFMRETERSIIAGLDFDDPYWPARLIDINVEIYSNDFPIYCAFTYDASNARLSLYYSTQALIPDIREHYKETLDNVRETGVNDVGNLNLEGYANGRHTEVRNYLSDVANIVSIEMDYTGKESETIRDRLILIYPAEQISESSISHFAKTEATSGYVLYSFDDFATDSYAKVPIFSRRYPYDGTIETLNNEIGSVPGRLGADIPVTYGGNRVMLQENGYLFTVNSMETAGGVFAVVTAQRIPNEK